jgi:hypothetical protein
MKKLIILKNAVKYVTFIKCNTSDSVKSSIVELNVSISAVLNANDGQFSRSFLLGG